MSEENIHLRLYSVEYKFKNTYSCIDAAEADDRALSFPQLDMCHPLFNHPLDAWLYSRTLKTTKFKIEPKNERKIRMPIRLCCNCWINILEIKNRDSQNILYHKIIAGICNYRSSKDDVEIADVFTTQLRSIIT